MPCTCVVGLQWGDEAKGKVVDVLTDHHDIVVRYNGGPNAGHTVMTGNKTFKLLVHTNALWDYFSFKIMIKMATLHFCCVKRAF